MTDEVTFVFVGGRLPQYAVASLQLAVQTSGLKVRLVGSRALGRDIPQNVRFTALEDFYEPAAFANASQRALFSHQAGNGFWLKTLERFFVLGQFQEHSGQSGFFMRSWISFSSGWTSWSPILNLSAQPASLFLGIIISELWGRLFIATAQKNIGCCWITAPRLTPLIMKWY
jgi:hypothetical protein